MHCIEKTPNPSDVVAENEDPTWTRDFSGPMVTALRAAQNKQQTSQSPEARCNIQTQTNTIYSTNTKPQIILPDPTPHNHTYISPTPSTLDTTLPKQNNTNNTHPQKTRQFDTIADSEAPYNVAHTQPTLATTGPRIQQLHPAPDTRLKKNNMQSKMLPKHHIHITRTHMHINLLQGPTPVRHLCTKAYIAIPLAAQDPLRDAKSNRIIEKSTVPNWGNLELRDPSANSPLDTLPTRALSIS